MFNCFIPIYLSSCYDYAKYNENRLFNYKLYYQTQVCVHINFGGFVYSS